MIDPDFSIPLASLRKNFQSGLTRSYEWRRRQLQALKQALAEHEEEIHAALYADLKKSPEEAYATETGLLLAEINVALKKLRKWMRPRSVGTNLVNLPSSSRIYRDPLGVVLIIAPWNYPFQLSFIPLIGAIAGGNCAVLKPSEMAPATSAVILKIIGRIFPSDYILALEGEGSAIVPALIRSFRFDHIFFTGSIPVGRAIYQLAAADLVPVTLELGGKSPAMVERDADLRTAARRIAVAKFANAGQTCVAPDYLLLHVDIKDKFLRILKETILHFYGEKPEESYSYGKIINEQRFDKLLSYLSQGRIFSGGGHDRKRLFIAPTVLEEVALDAPLMREEIFGPLLPVFTFHNLEEALAIIRLNPDPLSAYLFTRDTHKERAWIEQLPFGGGCINNAGWHFANHHMPFGGVGNSGLGSYHGKYSYKAFTHAKAIMKTSNHIDPDLKYPPFKGKLKWFKWFIR
ncbi:MAG: aldehyde dehydrogenase [Bacteroidota bacterium]|nr:aldehyde dehydrogenase [Bacteroidota bacterium]MDP4258250.1 aldehyde dehydrogenase [Bacteroidota bacterium]